jgi:hypothetical protein
MIPGAQGAKKAHLANFQQGGGLAMPPPPLCAYPPNRPSTDAGIGLPRRALGLADW